MRSRSSPPVTVMTPLFRAGRGRPGRRPGWSRPRSSSSPSSERLSPRRKKGSSPGSTCSSTGRSRRAGGISAILTASPTSSRRARCRRPWPWRPSARPASPKAVPRSPQVCEFLERALAGDVSTASLAWCLLALKGYPGAAAAVPGLAGRLARLQTEDGAFRGNLFETALSFLVLSDAPILGASPREAP